MDGVYTTDPRMVPEARRLPVVSFEEMLELAGQGSRVLHLRSVEFAARHGMKLRVLSSFEPGPGTLICEENPNVEAPVVSGIAFNRDEAAIAVSQVPHEAGVAHAMLAPVSAAAIEVDMIVINAPRDGRVDVTFTVHRDDYARALELDAQGRGAITRARGRGRRSRREARRGRLRHALARGRRGEAFRDAGPRRHQCPPGLDLRDQDQRAGGGNRARARGARAAQGLRARALGRRDLT